MHESSNPTSGTRSIYSRSTARTSSADIAKRTRAIVVSSRKALSSPFLQHHPLHREQAVRATRAAKPSGSGRRGETECSGFFVVRNERKVTAKCLRSRITRSRDIGTAALSFLDVSGATYTYLLNGQPPGRNWTALFRPGERVRLRFINRV